jgi:RNA-binding protein NOB1
MEDKAELSDSDGGEMANPVETIPVLLDENAELSDSDCGEMVNPVETIPVLMEDKAELSDSDGGEWITPLNIKSTLQEPQPESINVACITTDFAMQNVLLQMNLNLISLTGLRITKVKSWVLRCHACFTISKKLDLVFCPSCGNNALIRTSCGVDKRGRTKLYLKKDFQYNNRGTQYCIPVVKGGRKGQDLILRGDQREYEQAVKQKARIDKKALSMDMTDLDDLISGSGRFSTSAKVVVGYGRKNVNHCTKSKRK